MITKLSVHEATIFSCSKHPPPPLMRLRSQSTSSAPSMVQCNYKNQPEYVLIEKIESQLVTLGWVSKSPNVKRLSMMSWRAWNDVGIQTTLSFSSLTRSAKEFWIERLNVVMIIYAVLATCTFVHRLAVEKIILSGVHGSIRSLCKPMNIKQKLWTKGWLKTHEVCNNCRSTTILQIWMKNVVSIYPRILFWKFK